ncbi:hypothetical protein [Salsipaludibacter albus]|uniref:hypothetical protein n=1 Tax=Salsipaludibacter albus TaxID=2849650 RepID=UPI001EE4D4F9|nr:hypothetical protein [Salsipaludibacter albus]MBY5161022.1 hypothetical protein [Salsipaludibacter albus]
MLPASVVVLVGLLFVVDARQPPNRAEAEVLEADVRLELGRACTPVGRGGQTLLVSPGAVVVDEAREVTVDLPVLANDLPDGVLVGVGIATAGVDSGSVGVPFDPRTMSLQLGETVVTGPGRWPIVVAYRPREVGELTLLGSMTMRAAAGYRPPAFTLALSEDCAGD